MIGWYLLLCCFLTCVLPAQADVQCDDVDDLLTSSVTLDALLTSSAFTIMGYVTSTGAALAGDTCWSHAPMLGDRGGTIALGRSGASGGACAYIYDAGIEPNLQAAMTAGPHHFALRLSGGTLTLFVDGVAAASSGAGSVGSALNTLTWEICGQQDNSKFSPDRITEVKTYAGGLSDAEIAILGRSRVRLATATAPSAYWPLNDCAEGASGNGVTFVDRTGGGRNVTGNAGAGTGLTCHGTSFLSRPWGIQ